VREGLEGIGDLYMRQEMVVDILTEEGECRGVVTQTGQEFYAPNVILTSGTFLNGVIHIGEEQYGGGRSGEGAATGLSAALERMGFETGRLKTGTPPRIDGRTIDLDRMEKQYTDEDPVPFSFLTDEIPSETRPCYLTETTPEVHEVLRQGFDRSPMFCGRIEGEGPRYCPSIEDKIERFDEKDHHQIFIEPEGRETYEMYPNGFSSSLPEEIQFEAIRKVPGMENVHLLRPGYAIEYDYSPPYQINYSMETKKVPGLFFAGQINGTTGYEEAAAQGLMAGINAVQRLEGEDPVVLKRSEAYIGVLIDDLVAKGTDGEPYRMFTSRAEYRILLRQENADLRLTELGRELGMVSDERYRRFRQKKQALESTKENIESKKAEPSSARRGRSTDSQPPTTTGRRVQSKFRRPCERALPITKVHASNLVPKTSTPNP
jgi:tRNA uridine 5-carboxymethylaminomethyl modification enzyme